MENIENMNDVMQQMQLRVEQLKLDAIEKQQELAKSLNTKIQQGSEIKNKLHQSQQQLSAQMEYSTSVLVDLERGIGLDFNAEIAEFEQAYQESEDKTALTQHLETKIQEKIAIRLNELKARTNVALQELNSVNEHIQKLFNCDNNEKSNRLSKLKEHINNRFSKQILSAKECLARQLERATIKLRA